MRRLIVLGCTGSIGQTAMGLLREDPRGIHIAGLSANTRRSAMLALAREFGCEAVATPLADSAFEESCRQAGARLFAGSAQMVEASDATLVLNGIGGAAGLEASIAALSSGKDLALANKESMVMAGPLLKRLARSKGRRIIPVDSEHSAIHELVKAHGADSVDKLVITASGGPFRLLPRERLAAVTPEQASNHPTWRMGAKISIDSATLANKALEVVEAGLLFDIPASRILTVVHPQSQVHSLVSLRNGQTYAQISEPTMRFPILNAICEGFGMTIERPLNTPLFDLGREVHLDFYPMDFARFPLVRAGFLCLERGGDWPVVLNASNEVAVDAFRQGRIKFDQIEAVVLGTLDAWGGGAPPESFADVWEADRRARALALSLL